MIKSFRKFYISNDENLNRVQDNIAATFSSIEADKILNKIEITAAIAATATVISHGLNKQPTGWLIFDKDANANIWRISMNKSTIILQASAPVNISFYLF